MIEICKKWIFLNFKLACDIGCSKWPDGSGDNVTIEADLPRPFVYWDMGPFVGQNNRKSSKFFVFGYGTWVVKLNGHKVGIIFDTREV